MSYRLVLPNYLKDEISFLSFLNASEKNIFDYVRLSKEMDEKSFANALGVSLQTLKKIEAEKKGIPPFLKARLLTLLRD